MTVDLKSPNNIVFIRRRLKLGETAPTTAQVTPVTSGLNLNRAITEPTTIVPTPEKKVRKSSVPMLNANKILTQKNKSVRLPALQSAVGTLTIENSVLFAWETKARETGFNYRDAIFKTDFQSTKQQQMLPALPEISTPNFGNRKLAEYVGQEMYVTLRHVKNIRRIVVLPEQGKALVVKTSTGKTITVEYSENTVLYISVVDSKLELRIENVHGNIYETFRIGTYTPVTY